MDSVILTTFRQPWSVPLIHSNISSNYSWSKHSKMLKSVSLDKVIIIYSAFPLVDPRGKLTVQREFLAINKCWTSDQLYYIF